MSLKLFRFVSFFVQAYGPYIFGFVGGFLIHRSLGFVVVCVLLWWETRFGKAK